MQTDKKKNNNNSENKKDICYNNMILTSGNIEVNKIIRMILKIISITYEIKKKIKLNFVTNERN